jgi:hypothetical protein
MILYTYYKNILIIRIITTFYIMAQLLYYTICTYIQRTLKQWQITTQYKRI